MTLSELSEGYGRLAQTKALIRELSGKSDKSIFLKGLHCSSAPLLFCGVARNAGHSCILIVLNDQEEAAYFYHDMVQTIGEENVLYFPSAYRRAAKYGQKDDASEILRTEVLSRLTTVEPGGQTLVIVSSPDALAEKVVSKSSLEDKSVQLSVGQTMDREELQERLYNLGFERVDYVYEPGQYALRGSILDVFSFSSEYPLRIDFFGDDIDSIRQFSVETQLSTEKKESVVIVPDMDKVEGSQVSLMDFLPADTVLAVKDLLLTADRMDAVSREVSDSESLAARMRQLDAQKEGDVHPEEMPSLLTAQDFLRKTTDFRVVEFGNKPTNVTATVITFDTVPQPLFHKNFELVSKTLTDYIVKGYRIYILTDNPKQGERLEAIFTERGENIPFQVIGKTLHEGYADGLLKCCFFTDHQIFDRYHKYNLRSDRARNGKVALTLKELQEFQIGDYVVHIDHGVGKFGGLVRVPEGGGYQEKIKIIYKNDDLVLVSIHSLHKVSKYKGKEGEEPHINKLGTGAWESMKERTKGKIKDIARDLIKLYAKRLEDKGFAFSPDSYLQNELEASFMYEDTPDQLKATLDVKADMESSRPMDRLVCGDVGFGKTEVAMRAAFKAATDGKQVAVLVPTTVLALQHYNTFTERMKNLPVRIEYLSRFKSQKETKELLADLSAGKIDILIGTHKLIGKGVKWHDLGLLIIDEEQKFGVAAKEKLKSLRANVDVLTLTATPIPRTLQFSLLGARDLSIMTTPPQNRYPVQTELITLDDEDIIKEAIELEMGRNGQVFIVNNRIEMLPRIEARIHALCPQARIVVAHGQLPGDEMEKRLEAFINYDYDILISTTIIESGVDIPNVNTILIFSAHRYGLADLHQLRGRVGRSNRKAYCYLIAPEKELLTDDARRRLEAVSTFAELGAGFNLAMQDLDIRGAGNMLGSEQSGFIADLGYETYQRILNEAIEELKDEEGLVDEGVRGLEDSTNPLTTNPLTRTWCSDCQLETDLPICFPAEYIENISERITLYRELDSLRSEEQLTAYRKRLIDRFGVLPESAEELLNVVRLRWICCRLGIEKILLKAERMTMYLVRNREAYWQSETFARIIYYATTRPERTELHEETDRKGHKTGRRYVTITNVKTIGGAMNLLTKIEKDLTFEI